MTNLAVVKLVTLKIIKNGPESITSSGPTSQLCYQPDGKEPSPLTRLLPRPSLTKHNY